MYGAVPPDTVKLTDPVDPPKHKTFVATAPAVSAEGCVIVAVAVCVQPPASVTVTL